MRLRKLNRCLTNSPIFSCVHADALLADFDDRRLKRSVAGGAISFFGGYLFIRGSRFDDAQTTAVVAGLERRPVPARAPARPPQSWGPFLFYFFQFFL